MASKMRQYLYILPVISSFMKSVAWTFLVKCHLDVVLEVLQMVGSKIFMKLVDIYHRMVALIMEEIFNLMQQLKKKRVLEVWATKNFKKTKWLEGSIYILWRIFEKTAKKSKLKQQDPEKIILWTFSYRLTKNDVFPFLWLHF